MLLSSSKIITTWWWERELFFVIKIMTHISEIVRFSSIICNCCFFFYLLYLIIVTNTSVISKFALKRLSFWLGENVTFLWHHLWKNPAKLTFLVIFYNFFVKSSTLSCRFQKCKLTLGTSCLNSLLKDRKCYQGTAKLILLGTIFCLSCSVDHDIIRI